MQACALSQLPPLVDSNFDMPSHNASPEAEHGSVGQAALGCLSHAPVFGFFADAPPPLYPCEARTGPCSDKPCIDSWAAFLALALDALVWADARHQTLIALTSLAVILADARSAECLARACDAPVGADARPQTLLARGHTRSTASLLGGWFRSAVFRRPPPPE